MSEAVGVPSRSRGSTVGAVVSSHATDGGVAVDDDDGAAARSSPASSPVAGTTASGSRAGDYSSASGGLSPDEVAAHGKGSFMTARMSRREKGSVLSAFRSNRMRQSGMGAEALHLEPTISGPLSTSTTATVTGGTAPAGGGGGGAGGGGGGGLMSAMFGHRPTPPASSATMSPPPQPSAVLPATIRVELVHHRGYMWKRGGFHSGAAAGGKSWKKRWFELKDRSLFYYRTSMPVLLGVLQLYKEPPQPELIRRAQFLLQQGMEITSPEFTKCLLGTDGFFFAEVSDLPPAAADKLGLPSALSRREKAVSAAARAAGVGHNGPYVFYIAAQERSLFLACENADQYVEWVSNVRRLLRNEQQRLLAIVKSALPKALLTRPPATVTTGSLDGASHSGAGGGSSLRTGSSFRGLPSDGLSPSAPHSLPSVGSSLPGGSTATGGAGGLSALSPASDGLPTAMVGAPLAPLREDDDASTATPAPGALSPPPPARDRVTSDTGGTPHEPRTVIAAASVSAATSLQATATAQAAAASRAGSITHSVTSPPVGSLSATSRAGTLRSNGGGASGGNAGAGGSETWEISERDIDVVDRIGAGSFGEVYRGLLWGTDVAVKLLSASEVTQEVIDSLKAEVAILSQLRHPNVVLYLGACTTPPNIFIVTEWCERGSLHDILYDHTVPLSVATRLGLALQTAQGMAYLHSPRRQIIHRDLKSHNLLVTRDFTVKVADFGLTIMRTAHGLKTPARKAEANAALAAVSARVANRASMSEGAGAAAAAAMAAALLDGDATPGADGGDARARREEPGRQGKGLLAALHRHESGGAVPGALPSAGLAAVEEGQFYGVQGTPQWMAPEVMEGQKYNGSVDVYSFGVVLCELASRILPFSDRYKRFDFIDAVLEEGAMPTIPRWCDQLPAEVPPWLSETEDATAFGYDALPWGWKEDGAHMLRLPPIAVTLTNPPPLLGAVFVPPLPPSAMDDESHPLRPRAVTGDDSDGDRRPSFDSEQRSGVGGGGAGAAAAAAAPAADVATPQTKPVRSASAATARMGSGDGGHPDDPNAVLGGVEEWCVEKGECSGVLKLLIETCLSRNPDDRPTFEQLVELLRAVVDRPPAEVFMQLDVPRLREALAYGDETEASVAANEIIHFVSYALFCNMPALPLGATRPVLRLTGQGNQGGGSGSGTATADAASSPAVLPATRGLTMKFQPYSTLFSQLLPFAPPPGVSMSHMHSVPYVDLPTVLAGGPHLLAGESATRTARGGGESDRTRHSPPSPSDDGRRVVPSAVAGFSCAAAPGPAHLRAGPGDRHDRRPTAPARTRTCCQ